MVNKKLTMGTKCIEQVLDSILWQAFMATNDESARTIRKAEQPSLAKD
jgi:hypothetical protein